MNDYEKIMQIPPERRALIQVELINERIAKINKTIRELSKDKEKNFQKIGDLLFERKYKKERAAFLIEQYALNL